MSAMGIRARTPVWGAGGGRWLLVLTATLLISCGGGAKDTTEEAPQGLTGCGREEPDPFRMGVSKTCEPEGLEIQMVSADPQQPAVGDNAWEIRVLDGGEGLSGADVSATPFMPQHNHGTAQVLVTDEGDGQYRLQPVDFIMPGVWEITMAVTPEGGEESQACFAFLVPEI